MIIIIQYHFGPIYTTIPIMNYIKQSFSTICVLKSLNLKGQSFVDAYAAVNANVNADTKDTVDADADATVPLMLLYI